MVISFSEPFRRTEKKNEKKVRRSASAFEVAAVGLRKVEDFGRYRRRHRSKSEIQFYCPRKKSEKNEKKSSTKQQNIGTVSLR